MNRCRLFFTFPVFYAILCVKMQRGKAVMRMTADCSRYEEEEILLWEKISSLQDRVFFTAKGLEFRIRIPGNELFVDRRKKSITRASVNIAYQKWKGDPECGPKALGVFGASYLWSIFREIKSR